MLTPSSPDEISLAAGRSAIAQMQGRISQWQMNEERLEDLRKSGHGEHDESDRASLTRRPCLSDLRTSGATLALGADH